MQALAYYLSFPFIYAISRCPFFILYRISDFLFIVMYYVVGYRKKIVLSNLRNSFPEKSDVEISKIAKQYYVYLSDLLVETIKTLTWNEKSVVKHTKMHNVEILNGLYTKNKSILIVMGHMGNWEWAGPCFTLSCKHQLFVVYYPFTNPYFEKMFQQARTKFNTKIIPRNNTLKSIVANKNTIGATALIADQAPAPLTTAGWIDFLHQDTAVHLGPEKTAKLMDYPIVYMHVQRTRRGFYDIYPTVLFEYPKETGDLEITKGFNRKLEEEIRRQPETWLWSHKRWKNKRPIN